MFKLIFRHLKGPAAVCAVLAPLLMVGEVFFDLQQPTLMSNIIDVGVANRDLTYVLHTGLKMITFAVLGLIGGAGCSILATYASTMLAKNLRVSLFAKTQSLSFAEIDKLETSSLITRMTNDVSQMQMLLEMMLRAMIRAPLMCIGSIVMALLISPKLALVLCVSIPVLAIAVFMVITKTIPLYGLVQKQIDKVNTVMRENLLGIRVVKAFTMETQQRKRFNENNDGLTARNIKAQTTTFLLMPIVMLVMNLSVVAVLWFGGNMSAAGALPTGKIMAFVNYMVQIANSLAMFAGTLVAISRASASGSRIKAVLDTESSIKEPTQPQSPADYGIKFNNVSFKYSHSDYVLKNISFSIPQGQRVGIIGATGSGKSTLVSLIPRLYDVTDGSITIGGVDVRNISLKELHDKVGIVLQESLLFSGNISDNLSYGNDSATTEELWTASVAAQAGDFLSSLPEGLASRVEQRGRNFSGGQKQRLSIARTLLQRPEILILDDSGSALDLATESNLHQSVTEWMQGGTLILITQRIASIKDCDNILVLDGGTVSAQGTHEELLKSSEIYRLIAVSQLGEEVL